MKIAVAYKWAPNPQDASVSVDGSIDWTRGRPAISDYDAVAIEVARALADDLGAELIGLTVGASEVGTPFARKAALARGLDRLAVVADDRLVGAGVERVGVLLGRLAQRADADLLLAGDASLDVGAGLVPALAAAALGRPWLGRVTAIALVAGGFEVTQLTEGGVRVVRCAGPAVLSVAPDAAQPGVPGMKDVLAAAKKPSETVPLDELGVLPARPRVVSTGRPEPLPRERRLIDSADPDAAAAELVAALRQRGVLGGVR